MTRRYGHHRQGLAIVLVIFPESNCSQRRKERLLQHRKERPFWHRIFSSFGSRTATNILHAFLYLAEYSIMTS